VPVAGHLRLLERLVANLIENAVAHNHPGGRVSVTTSTRDGRSVVEVVNDGDVLDPAVLPSLLEPFQRIDRGARGDGVGLGLSIVRSVAQAHGGAVALAACPEGGLRATVSLPRGEPADATHPDRYSRERAHA
jgi:signal transduction histidine kinase